MIAFITGNKCFGNIVRDFRLMKEIEPHYTGGFLHFVPESLAHLYKGFSQSENIKTESHVYTLERQSLSHIHTVLARKRPHVVVSDLAFFGPLICKMLGLYNILVTQPYPIKGMYADNYNNCCESLQCADQIVLPVPSFFRTDPELEKHLHKTTFVGPLMPKEKSDPPGKDLLITYSSGFYGLKLHFDVLQLVDSIMDDDINLLLHTGGLSSKKDVETLTSMVKKSPYAHRIAILGFVDNLMTLLKQAKAVVCHGGNIMFESAMVGIPRLVVVPPLTQNTEHYENARHLQQIGAAELAFLGDPIKDMITSVLTDDNVRKYQIEVGKRICQWDGLEKTARLILDV